MQQSEFVTTDITWTQGTQIPSACPRRDHISHWHGTGMGLLAGWWQLSHNSGTLTSYRKEQAQSMICPHCRTENDDEVSSCSKCGSSFDLQIDVDQTMDSAGPSSAAEERTPRTPSGSSRGTRGSAGSASSSRTGARSSVG